jgi:hypothetical protein
MDCGAGVVNESCCVRREDDDVALLPGSINVKVWPSKSGEEEHPETVVSKGEGRKPLPGALVQEPAYSDEEVEKWAGGGEADEWESEIRLVSGEGPSIAVRMEYSRLAVSEP